MELNKKGILFTFLSIVISALLATIFSTHQITPLDSNIELERIRVESANQYLTNLFSYSEISLRMSSYIGLQEMIDYIEETTFYADGAAINKTFAEIVMNGTINGVPRPNMDNVTIVALMDRIRNVSFEELGINMTFNITRIWIDQQSPFAIRAYMSATIFVKKENVQWNITNTTIAKVTIEGLRDPLYLSIGYDSLFKETTTLPQKFNITSFEEFVNGSKYIVSPQSLINISGVGAFRPMSFFGRLANDPLLKPDSTLTLLSIVSPQRLEDEGGIPIASQPGNYSYIDFMYGTGFNSINCQTVLKKVVNTTNQPIVDRHHLALIFNLTNAQIYNTDTC